MCEFKKGDLVEVRDCDGYKWGNGIFVAHDEDSEYQYVVRKRGCAVGYKQCRKARPKLELDQNVWVSDTADEDDWHRGHFARWGYDGRIGVWCCGRTSHTINSPIDISYWKHYSLTKPE